MGFIIGLLTFILVLDCIALILLVLIQLPKKEAGAGLAFGGAASDALFGAGSGTVLTKITRYAATLFFILAIVLAIMQRYYSTRRSTQFERMLTQPGKAPASAVVAPSTSVTQAPAAPQPVSTNFNLTTPAAALTNPPSTITNQPAEAPR